MDVLIATDFFYGASPACGPVLIKMSIANQQLGAHPYKGNLKT
jgi:hypothetical protein